MTARQKREANLGIVLVSISVLFIVCQSVKIIPDVYEVFTCRITSAVAAPKAASILTAGADLRGCPEKAADLAPLKCPTTPLVDSIVDLSHLLLAINSSANVIIYTLRGIISFLNNCAKDLIISLSGYFETWN
jgi:hypothetical protein